MLFDNKTHSHLDQATSFANIEEAANDAPVPEDSFISIKLLQYLNLRMHPQNNKFDLVEFVKLIDAFVDDDQKTMAEKQQERQNKYQMEKQLTLQKSSSNIRISQKSEDFSKNEIIESLTQPNRFQETAQSKNLKNKLISEIMEQFRAIFIFYGSETLTYGEINEYIFNKQLEKLSLQPQPHQKDEEYLEIGEKRIRLNQNIKLCIMPLKGNQIGVQEGVEEDVTECSNEVNKSTKIKEVVFQENTEGKLLESVYVITKDYVRNVSIRPELIGNGVDFERKGQSQNKCWYNYSEVKIKPEKTAMNISLSQIEKPVEKAITNLQIKERKSQITELMPSHLLNVIKVCMSQNMMGIISLDKSFLVQPLSNSQNKLNQGYIGNIQRDLPHSHSHPNNNKTQNQEILLFQSYSDHQWLIITSTHIYLYYIPTPSENVIITDQNNVDVVNKITGSVSFEHRKNRLLIICSPLPKSCLQAIKLTKPFIALMLEQNMIIIIELLINSYAISKEGRKDVEIKNSYKITNKIYNDVKYKSMTFHQNYKFLCVSDFGSYLMRVKLNQTYGDIEEEGLSFYEELNKKIQKKDLNQPSTKNNVNKGTFESIQEIDEEDTYENYKYASLRQKSEIGTKIEVMKKEKGTKSKEYLSIYVKQTKSPNTVILRNTTREIIEMMTTNKHFNTLITYESQSYEKKHMSDFAGEKYKEYGNRNTIKLWDLRHMTVYQIFLVSIDVGFFSLRSNGLYAVTKERGYLGFYPLNQDENLMVDDEEQKILDQLSKQTVEELNQDIMIQNNTVFFHVLSSNFNKFNHVNAKQTKIYALELEKNIKISHVQTVPTEITSIVACQNVYVLENSTIVGLEACNLHIYNKMGLKQEMITFRNSEDVDVLTGRNLSNTYNQEYKNLKKIYHRQFNILLWNHQSMKFIGNNLEESLTIVFKRHTHQTVDGAVQEIRNLKGIEVGEKSLIIHLQDIKRTNTKTLSTITGESKHSKNSKNRNSEERRSLKRKDVYEQISMTMVVINPDTDRVIFKVENMPRNIKILHIYGHLILTQEESKTNNVYQEISVYDIAFGKQWKDKLLFKIKYKRSIMEKIKIQPQDYDQHKNLIIQQSRTITLRKLSSVEDAKIIITDKNNLVLLFVIKVEVYQLDQVNGKIIKSEISIINYVRNITDELLNKDYKITKINIGMQTKKTAYEYSAVTGRAENILGHKIISYDSLCGISNYSQFSFNEESFNSNEDSSNKSYDFSNIADLTSLIEGNISSKEKLSKRETFQCISLGKQFSLMKIIEATQKTARTSQKMAIYSNFSVKILSFDEQNLSGTISLSNKHLKTINLYNILLRNSPSKSAREALDQRYENDTSLLLQAILIDKMEEISEVHQVDIKVMKLGCFRYKQKLKNSTKEDIEVLEWNLAYKDNVYHQWNHMMENIKEFISEEKQCKKSQEEERMLSPKRKKSLTKLESKRIVTQPSMSKKYEVKLKKIQEPQENLPQNIKVNLLSQEINPEDPEKNSEKRHHTNSDEVSKMFKKWSIGQVISLEKDIREQQQLSELKVINKYIGKVIKNDDEKEKRMKERVDALINNTQLIKQASQSVVLPHQMNYYERKEAESGYAHKLKNVYKSYQLAHQSSLKKFVANQAIYQNTKHILNSDDKIKKSSISSLMNSKLLIPAPFRSKKSQSPNQNKSTERTLEGSLLTKLETIQSSSQRYDLEYSHSLQKQRYELNMSNNKKSSIIDSSFKKTRKSKTSLQNYNNQTLFSSPFQSKRKLLTQVEEIRSTQKSKLSSLQNKFARSPSKLSQIKLETEQESRYDRETSKIKLQRVECESESKKVKVKRSKTEMWQDDNVVALNQIQLSQNCLRSMVLPEIKSNRQKLMMKMKEKRSYVKLVQSHLNDSNIMQLIDVTERKRIIDKLYQYK